MTDNPIIPTECSISLNGRVYIYISAQRNVTRKLSCKFIDFVDGMSFSKNSVLAWAKGVRTSDVERRIRKRVKMEVVAKCPEKLTFINGRKKGAERFSFSAPLLYVICCPYYSFISLLFPSFII